VELERNPDYFVPGRPYLVGSKPSPRARDRWPRCSRPPSTPSCRSNDEGDADAAKSVGAGVSPSTDRTRTAATIVLINHKASLRTSAGRRAVNFALRSTLYVKERGQEGPVNRAALMTKADGFGAWVSGHCANSPATASPPATTRANGCSPKQARAGKPAPRDVTRTSPIYRRPGVLRGGPAPVVGRGHHKPPFATPLVPGPARRGVQTRRPTGTRGLRTIPNGLPGRELTSADRPATTPTRSETDDRQNRASVQEATGQAPQEGERYSADGARRGSGAASDGLAQGVLRPVPYVKT